MPLSKLLMTSPQNETPCRGGKGRRRDVAIVTVAAFHCKQISKRSECERARTSPELSTTRKISGRETEEMVRKARMKWRLHTCNARRQAEQLFLSQFLRISSTGPRCAALCMASFWRPFRAGQKQMPIAWARFPLLFSSSVSHSFVLFASSLVARLNTRKVLLMPLMCASFHFRCPVILTWFGVCMCRAGIAATVHFSPPFLLEVPKPHTHGRTESGEPRLLTGHKKNSLAVCTTHFVCCGSQYILYSPRI